MTTGHVFIATSLDGYIARLDGDIDWLLKQNTVDGNHGYDAFIETVDGLIMGRGSYEKALSFDEWPYTKPVVVMSQSLVPTDIPEALSDKVILTSLSPHEIMKSLDDKGWKRAYVDGGKVVQSFLRDGLISDISLTRIPILIGQGRPLFGPLQEDIDLNHLETLSYPSGLVTSRYSVA